MRAEVQDAHPSPSRESRVRSGKKPEAGRRKEEAGAGAQGGRSALTLREANG